LIWYGKERAPELASSQQAGYAIGHLARFFGAKATVSSITPQVLKRYGQERTFTRLRVIKGVGGAADRRENVTAQISRGTVRRELAVLQSALSHAVDEGRLTVSPAIKLPAPGRSKTRYLNEDEIARLLHASRGKPHLRLFIMLALNTGARKSALLELTWTQVRGNLVYLNPDDRDQTTKGRAIVPLNGTLAAALRIEQDRAIKEAEKRKIDPLPWVIQFRCERIMDIKKSFASACERAGIEDVTPHTLRHTAGTIMAKAGIDMFLIARMLGHSVAKTTELYAHHSPDWLAGATAALGLATTAGTTLEQVLPHLLPQE
jgi:integrase